MPYILHIQEIPVKVRAVFIIIQNPSTKHSASIPADDHETSYAFSIPIRPVSLFDNIFVIRKCLVGECIVLWELDIAQ